MLLQPCTVKKPSMFWSSAVTWRLGIGPSENSPSKTHPSDSIDHVIGEEETPISQLTQRTQLTHLTEQCMIYGTPGYRQIGEAVSRWATRRRQRVAATNTTTEREEKVIFEPSFSCCCYTAHWRSIVHSHMEISFWSLNKQSIDITPKRLYRWCPQARANTHQWPIGVHTQLTEGCIMHGTLGDRQVSEGDSTRARCRKQRPCGKQIRHVNEKKKQSMRRVCDATGTLP